MDTTVREVLDWAAYFIVTWAWLVAIYLSLVTIIFGAKTWRWELPALTLSIAVITVSEVVKDHAALAGFMGFVCGAYLILYLAKLKDPRDGASC